MGMDMDILNPITGGFSGPRLVEAFLFRRKSSSLDYVVIIG